MFRLYLPKRLLALILAALTTSGCTSSTPLESRATIRATAPETNQVPRAKFDSSVIEIFVPAGQWAMVRMDFGQLVHEQGAVSVVMGSRPASGAVPWTAYGSGNRRGGESATFTFNAHRPDGGGATSFSFNSDAKPGDGSELILVVGSMHAASTFYIGGDPGNLVLYQPSNLTGNPEDLITADFDGKDYEALLDAAVNALASRARLSVDTDWGDGGVAGTAIEVFYDGTNPYRLIAGAMNLTDEKMVEDPILGIVAKEITVDNRYLADRPGAFGSTGYVRYQAGAGDYSYTLDTPSFSRTDSSVHAGGSGYTHVYTGAENQYFPGSPDIRGGALFFHNMSAVREPGELTTQVYYRFVGQPGQDHMGVGSPALFTALPGYYVFRWGYFPCECKERFGWGLGTVDFF